MEIQFECISGRKRKKIVFYDFNYNIVLKRTFLFHSYCGCLITGWNLYPDQSGRVWKCHSVDIFVNL